MITLKEWIAAHPLISMSSIEKELKIPHGTIRLNDTKDIPERYVAEMEVLLSDYGYGEPTQEEKQGMIVIKNKNKPDTILNPDNIVERYDTVYQCDEKGLHINSVAGLRYYKWRPGREYLLKLLPVDWAEMYGNQANKIKW